MDFDLGKLTAVGWIVLLATFAICLAGAYMAATMPGAEQALEGSRSSRRLIGYVMLGVAVAFFVGCKALLGKIGLPMFRQ